MFRLVWRFPLYGSAVPSVVTITTTEAWAFPVRSWPVSSGQSWTEGIPDLVEAGHKESI